MLFNSVEFIVFFVIIFITYWFLFENKIKWQNATLLIGSYIFYGWWEWKFLLLIVLSSAVDYIVGLGIQNSTSRASSKKWLLLSLIVNLGMLCVFKYYNFFIEEFVQAVSSLGFRIQVGTLNIILPVGISFYTFQTLSYSIDVYRGKMKATGNALNFFTYVAFFPQLVAGPIERASHLLPQFSKKRSFDYPLAISGTRLILWGFFKKIVIADNAAIYVNPVFENYELYNNTTLIVAIVLFAFQIYCDFSGYSDIAIGVARLLGFNLMRNFRYPYFSRDIAEFWRRWHISLSTWFRDYLYIPIGGSKGSKLLQVRNVIVIFAVSGLWHGANWTFLIWGVLNAMFFLPLLLSGRNRKNTGEIDKNVLFPSFRTSLNILLTFSLTCLAWIFFRSETLYDANMYLLALFSAKGIFARPSISFILILIAFILIEWVNQSKECPLFMSRNRTLNWLQYYGVIFVIGVYGNFGYNEFIYFQF